LDKEALLVLRPEPEPMVDRRRNEQHHGRRGAQEGCEVHITLDVRHLGEAVREGNDQQEGEKHLDPWHGQS
jgi:hypothetical protein